MFYFVVVIKPKRPIILCKKSLNKPDTPLPLIDSEAQKQRRVTVTNAVTCSALVSGLLADSAAHGASTIGDAVPVPVSMAFLLGTVTLVIALAAAGLVALRQRAHRLEVSDFLRLTFENMAHGAVVYDADQRVAAFNKRYIGLAHEMNQPLNVVRMATVSGDPSSLYRANTSEINVFAIIEKPIPLRSLSRFVLKALGREAHQDVGLCA